MTARCALPSAESSTAAQRKTVMIISVSSQQLFNAIWPPHADPGRLERGPPAPGRASLSSPSLLPRHGSERRCFKCQTGHTCEGLSALAEYKACLWGVPPPSVEPEAEPKLIVCRQLTCRGGRNTSNRRAAWREYSRNILFHNTLASKAIFFLFSV